MIEILAVGVAVDHGAAEFQLSHAAFQLVGRGFGILHGQMPKAGIAVRPLGDFARQKIIGFGGPAPRDRGVALVLHARSGDGEHRAGNAGAIHRLQPHIAEILQAREQPARHFRIDIGNGGQPVFFEAGI